MDYENDDLTEDQRQFLRRKYEDQLAYFMYLQAEGIGGDLSERILQLKKELRELEDAEVNPLYDAVRELQHILAFVDGSEDTVASSNKQVVKRIGKIRVVIWKEENHSLPHFHIKYKTEYSASYAINTLERLAGSMPEKYEKHVLPWAENHKARLLEIWNALKVSKDVQVLLEEL